MNVEVSIRIDCREVACLNDQVETLESLPLEPQTEELKDRIAGCAGRWLFTGGFVDVSANSIGCVPCSSPRKEQQ